MGKKSSHPHGSVHATPRCKSLSMKKKRQERKERQDRKRKAGARNLQKYHKKRKKQRQEIKEKELQDVIKDLIYPKEGDHILTLKKKWIEKVLSAIKEIQKRMEVRPTKCNKPRGTIIYLSESGTGKIQGYVTYDGCKLLTQENWEQHRHLHRVPGGLYYKGLTPKTKKPRENWGWCFKDPHTFPTPIPYKKTRARDWKYYHSV